MEHNCLLPILSSAYRQGHSTESALLKVHADILHNMEQQMVTLLVIIDLSAAFNTVDHPILFQCLEEQFGFLDSVLSWYKSYLSDRKQCIILKGMQSNTFDLPFGVPQGSCFGPVLFTQYASSLFSIFSKHSVCAHAYADYHQLYTAFSPNLVSLNEAVSCMESCLQDVKSGWSPINSRWMTLRPHSLLLAHTGKLQRSIWPAFWLVNTGLQQWMIFEIWEHIWIKTYLWRPTLMSNAMQLFANCIPLER